MAGGPTTDTTLNMATFVEAVGSCSVRGTASSLVPVEESRLFGAGWWGVVPRSGAPHVQRGRRGSVGTRRPVVAHQKNQLIEVQWLRMGGDGTLEGDPEMYEKKM